MIARDITTVCPYCGAEELTITLFLPDSINGNNKISFMRMVQSVFSAECAACQYNTEDAQQLSDLVEQLYYKGELK